MRVLFYGTPDFSLPTLEALLSTHQVVGVVTQPDRPAHRGQRLTPPPVKLRALEAGMPVVQPSRLRDPGWPEQLAAFHADVAVVVAFGQILPKAVLEVPRRGSINVHASVLPRYRGAAPIAWALIRGERETGITTFQMDEGMDTGPMLLRRSTPIGDDETAGELAARLSVIGAEVMIETLARLDSLLPEPQAHDQATLAPRLKKPDGHLDWRASARDLVNRVRGCNPWPGALTMTPRGPLTIWRATATERPATADTTEMRGEASGERADTARGAQPGRAVASRAGASPDAEPGSLLPHDRSLAILTGDGLLLPTEVQPENRRVVAWSDWLRGARVVAGDRLSSPAAS